MGYKVNPHSIDELRHMAAQRFGAPDAADIESLTKEQIAKLLEEQAISKIETETQNAYLQDTCARLETALNEVTDFYDFAPLGFVRTDAAGKISRLNLAAASLLGAERSALKGQIFADLFPLEQSTRIVSGLRDATASGEDQRCEVSLGSTARADPHVQLTLSPLYTMQGHHIFLNNITDRYALQSELQARVDGWKGALEHMGDGLWEWDLRLDTFNYGPALTQLYGRSSEPIGGVLEGWRERVHPQDWPGLLVRIQRCLKGEQASFQSEHRAWRADGDWTWTLCCGSVLSRDETGMAVRLVGIDTDISERKRVEGDLREASRIKRTLFDLLPQYLAVLDSDARVLRTNALWNAYGLTSGQPYRDGFAGQAYAELLDGVTGACEPIKHEVLAGIAEVLDGKLPVFQMEYTFEAGTQKQCFIMHVMGVQDARARAVVSHQDVTRIKLPCTQQSAGGVR